MDLSKIFILVFFALFHLLTAAIEIHNFENVTFSDEEAKFIYYFSPNNLQDNKGAYFFFKLSYNFPSFYIIDGDGTKEEINKKDNNVFIFYKIEKLIPQKFTFLIKSDFPITKSIFLIDNSKVINLNFDQFYHLNFRTLEIKEDTPPLPLIFNITIKEKTIINLTKSIDSDNIYDGKSLIEYCEINENGCNYITNENKLILIFENGKNYKIKYNCYHYQNKYYFSSYEISSIIKEVGYGFYGFKTDNRVKNYYYILDPGNLENFYIYTWQDKTYFYYYFITKDEKNYLKKTELVFHIIVIIQKKY